MKNIACIDIIDNLCTMKEEGSSFILTLVTLWPLEGLGLVVVTDTF